VNKAVLLAASLGVAAQTQAQTAVTNRNQIVNGQTFTWNNATGSGPLTFNLGGVGATASGNGSLFGPCVVGACWSGGFNSGQYITMLNSGANQVTFTFASDISAFATQAWFSSGFVGGNIVVDAFRGNTLTGTYNFTTGGGAINPAQASVMGVLDNSGFDKLVFTSSPNGGSEDFAMNDITFLSSTVPEPSTYALMLVGLGTIGFAARRRRA